MRVPEVLGGKPVESPAGLALLVGKLALFLFFLGLCAYVLSGGGMLRAAFIVLLILAPVAVYVAAKWPLVFPFAAYVFLVPLNDLLGWQQFGTLNKLLGGASFLALAIWLLRNRTAVMQSVTPLAWLALAAWMTTSGIWALSRSDWWELLPTFFQLVGLYAIVGLVPVRAFELRVIWFAVVVGGLAAAGFVIYGYFHGHQFFANRVWLIAAGGDLVDPNHLAGALFLPIWVTTTTALSERNWLGKAGLVLCLCTLMAGVYLSGSRDALVALLIACVYFLWKTPQRRQLLLVLSPALLVAIPIANHLLARFAVSERDTGRLYIWQVGLHSLRDYWLLGAGQGNFGNAFYENYLHLYSSAPMEINYPRAGHNLILTSMVELGILGVVLMLVAWWSQFRVLRLIPRWDPLYSSRIALEAACLALFLSSLFLDNMFRKYTWLIFSAMALLRSRYITSANEGLDPTNDPPLSRFTVNARSEWRSDVEHKSRLP
jgi:hypothetical protein